MRQSLHFQSGRLVKVLTNFGMIWNELCKFTDWDRGKVVRLFVHKLHKISDMEDFAGLDGEEKLKAENAFYKLKLMLEEDMCFEGPEWEQFSIKDQNQLLNSLIHIENMQREGKRELLFDKIGCPDFFYPDSAISDQHIDKALERMLILLHSHNIHLETISPNTSPRELYRFVVEELIHEELNDCGMPNREYHFVYDDFHPDPLFESISLAQEDCMGAIFSKTPVKWLCNFFEEDLCLNQYYPLTAGQFKRKINRFKNAFDNIELNDIQMNGHHSGNGKFEVYGTYRAIASQRDEIVVFSGDWLVTLQSNGSPGYPLCPDIKSVSIEGVDF